MAHLLKELEKLSTLDIAENDIAKDALYCDLKFVLDAMKIDLVGSTQRIGQSKESPRYIIYKCDR